MSKPSTPSASTTASDPDTGEETDLETDPAVLRAQLGVLAEENRRLRTEYARARQSRYRKTALGLAAVGGVAAVGALLFPATRDVFVAFAAIGFFAAVLTYYLTPERFVAAEVSERVYAALATNHADLADALGLTATRVYVPTDDDAVTLFVPQSDGGDLEAVTAPSRTPLVVEDDARGLRLHPTGGALLEAFEAALVGDLAGTPEALATQLCEGLGSQFELARGVEPDLDPEEGRLTVAITEPSFGELDRFDHPIPSFLAAGLATGLDRPVTVECTPGGDRADWLVTCRWDDHHSSPD